MRHLTLLLVVFVLLFANSCKEEQVKPPKQYTIEQFYANTRIGGGQFSEDETKLLVSSNETGIYNVFEINIADASKKQITFSEKESYFAIDYVPGTGEILYSADKGGNEITHIYMLKNDTLSVDLTPEEKARASFGGWSKDKKYMYYISNKRDPKYFDFYKMNMEDMSSEMLYQNNDGINISGMSEDENFFALSKSITTNENKLFLFDRSLNKTVDLSEEAGKYSSSGFSKDNMFYYISDVGKEFAYLVEYNPVTEERKVLYETNWDVMYSYLSENETYRVIGINEDGKNKLLLLDNATQEPVDFPEIKDGDVLAVNISDSEKLMRLSVGSSTSTSNMYVYKPEDKSLEQLTNTLNPDIEREDLAIAEVVRYKSFDDLDIPAIYYKPLTATAENKVPALVWVHGGPGGQSRIGFSELIQYLVNHGYAVLAVNNRGSSGYGKTFYSLDDLNHGDKDLKDCVWGKKWLQEQDYIDNDKIGIIGGSYGGYMTMAALAFTPDEFEVGVNIFGVTNWLRTLRSIPPWWEANRNALYKELGDPNTEDSVRLYEISPLFHAENVKKPLMVLQGANDPRVLQVESDEIVEAVKKNGVPVEYVIFPDEGHGFRKKENQIKGYGMILEFLDKYLKKEEVDKETKE